MNTIEDFENAPVGATATAPNGNIAIKTGRSVFEWSIYDSRGNARDNHPSDEMGRYTLNSVAPTNSREALDLAWDFAHEVKEGQVIPKGTGYLARHSEPTQEFIATDDIEIVPWLVGAVRTHDRLPRPVPDWLDAPAVLAAMDDCSWQKVWLPSTPGHWECTCCGVDRHWSEMTDVTPLYPKEGRMSEYTPTREEIADTIYDALEDGGWYSVLGHYPYEVADAVLALLKGQEV